MSIITINVFLKYLESGISPDSLESKLTQLRSASLGGKMKNCQDKIRCYPMHCSLPGSSLHGISQAIFSQWCFTLFAGGKRVRRSDLVGGTLQTGLQGGYLLHSIYNVQSTRPGSNMPVCGSLDQVSLLPWISAKWKSLLWLINPQKWCTLEERQYLNQTHH